MVYCLCKRTELPTLAGYASETYAILGSVGVGRLELPTLAGYASETYAYTSSATRPLRPGKYKKTSSLPTGGRRHMPVSGEYYTFAIICIQLVLPTRSIVECTIENSDFRKNASNSGVVK
jgi:hypothetical protein